MKISEIGMEDVTQKKGGLYWVHLPYRRLLKGSAVYVDFPRCMNADVFHCCSNHCAYCLAANVVILNSAQRAKGAAIANKVSRHLCA